MSLLTAFIIMGAVLLGIVLLCFGATWLEKQKHGDFYDERQQLVRGRGHRLANIMGFAYMLVILPELIGQADGEKHVEAYLLVFAGFMIQMLVFYVYCFISHAALPLSSRPLAVIPCYLLIGVIYLVPFCKLQRWGGASLVGHGSMGLFDLMMSFYWIILALMHIIELFRREKE